MPSVDVAQIPNRSLFRQPEVCDIAHVQPYVLRSWEAEFPDLGVAKTQGGPRVYRRADVERVLKIKHLLFVDGLTLAGVRRKLQEEQPSAAPDGATLDDLLSADVRERILGIARSSLDLASEGLFLDTIRELRGQRTVLLVTHRLTAAQRCDRMVVLDRGRLVDADGADLHRSINSNLCSVPGGT